MAKRFIAYTVGKRGRSWKKLTNARKEAKRQGGTQEIFGYRSPGEGLVHVDTVRNPKGKISSVRKAKKYAKKAGGSAAGFSAYGKVKGKARKAKSKAKKSRPNPGTALKAKIKQMKPRTWYSTTLSGARVKVKRVGQGLVVRPATKKRKR